MKEAKQIMYNIWGSKSNRQLSIVVCLFVLLTVFLGNRFDYKEYERQWQFFLGGENPWDYGSNAYGALHNLMAFFYQINSKLPRLLFAVLSMVATIFLIKSLKTSKLDEKQKNQSFYLLLYNPKYGSCFL